MDAPLICPDCGERVEHTERFNDHVVKVDSSTGFYKSLEPRKLDPTKIDWHSFSHTHASMIKRGVYPEGVTIQEVMEKVKGTFGGRFTQFGNGHFEYVAYTD